VDIRSYELGESPRFPPPGGLVGWHSGFPAILEGTSRGRPMHWPQSLVRATHQKTLWLVRFTHPPCLPRDPRGQWRGTTSFGPPGSAVGEPPWLRVI
jgi:hypothetical protein